MLGTGKVVVVDCQGEIESQRERRGYWTRNLLVGLALPVAAATVVVAVDASIPLVDAAALAASFAVA
jgi:hypothetical protein